MGYFYRSREEKGRFFREHKLFNFVFLSEKLQQYFPMINTTSSSSSSSSIVVVVAEFNKTQEGPEFYGGQRA